MMLLIPLHTDGNRIKEIDNLKETYGWMDRFYELYFHTSKGLIGQQGTMTMR